MMFAFAIATSAPSSVPFLSSNIASMCKTSRRCHRGRPFFLGDGNNSSSCNNDNNNNNKCGWRSLTAVAVRATRAAAAPSLIFSSPTKPDYRYLFDITPDQKLQLSRKIHLPQISGELLIGSSQGILFSIPPCSFPTISATDPLTESHHPKPSASNPATTIGGERVPLEDILMLDGNFREMYTSRVILSPSYDTILLFVMTELYFASRGCSPFSWNSISFLLNSRCPTDVCPDFLVFMMDCIFHKGRLHIADRSGNLAIVDFKDPSSPPFFLHMDDPIDVDLDHFKRYLVESPNGDDLFLLCRVPFYWRSKYFDVFKLDKECCKWNRVENIGDVAMFVGRNSSMSVSTREFPNLKPNSIYFMNDIDYLFPENIGGTGVFSMEDKEIHFFDDGLMDDGLEKLTCLPPIWFSPPTAAC